MNKIHVIIRSKPTKGTNYYISKNNIQIAFTFLSYSWNRKLIIRLTGITNKSLKN